MVDAWYEIADAEAVASPALLVFPDRVQENIRRMIGLAGGVDRLRPHVKTHKMREVIALQQAAGIDRFKCSTLAEAEMVASCQAADVLLAFPQLGPNVERLRELAVAFPATRFATVTDDAASLARLAAAFHANGQTIDVLLDIDNGMHRSGIEPGAAAAELYGQLASTRGVRPGGLHVYDGHVREFDLNQRIAHAEADFAAVQKLVDGLESAGLPVPEIVTGGTPTFPVHARNARRTCSPGTCLFWDVSYGTKFPDLDFQWAAVLLARVISKPGPGRLCLDLGYKSVAPDNPELRVQLLNVPEVRVINHSEEHLAVETPAAGRFAVGDVVYGIPFHVCPTVALHREVVVCREGRAVERWLVAARDRRITY